MRKLLLLLSLAALQAACSATMMIPERGVIAQWDNWVAGQSFDGFDTYIPDVWVFDEQSELSLTDSPDALVYEGVSYAECYDGRDGVLLVNGLGYENMDFFIPNYIGGENKEITIQIIYQSTGSEPLIGVSPYLNGELMTEGIYANGRTSHVSLEGYWFCDTFEFVVIPNPDYEYITLGFENNPVSPVLAVDSVTVETVCVPEPATLCFMALGSLTLLRKRK